MSIAELQRPQIRALHVALRAEAGVGDAGKDRGGRREIDAAELGEDLAQPRPAEAGFLAARDRHRDQDATQTGLLIAGVLECPGGAGDPAGEPRVAAGYAGKSIHQACHNAAPPLA